MKPLRILLRDDKDKILQVTREKGQWEGMRYAGVRHSISFRAWLGSVAGNEDYGVSPTKPETKRTNYWLTMQGLTDTDNLIARKYSLLGTLRADIEKLEQERRLKLFQFEQLAQQGEPRIQLSEVME